MESQRDDEKACSQDKSRDLIGTRNQDPFFQKDRWLVFLILFLALILRLRGISLLLPYFESGPDERYLIDPALHILKTGDLNPHFFWYGSFPIYWITVIYGLVLGIGCWAGGGINTIGKCLADFGAYDHGFELFYLGRVTSIAFGLATIYLVYVLGRRLFNRETGILSAWFFALAPLHIYFSQIFKVDISLLFFTLLAFYFFLNILEGGKFRDYLWAGVFMGLALGTKYFYVVSFPLFAVLFRPGVPRIKELVKGGLVLYLALLILLATCPFAVLDWPDFKQQMDFMTDNINHLVYGRVETLSFLSIGFHRLAYIFPLFFGPLIFVTSLWGGVRMVLTDWRRAVLFWILPAGYFLSSTWYTRDLYPQYQFPIFPFVVLAGSWVLVSLCQSRSGAGRFLGWGILLLSTVFFLSDLKYPHFSGIHHPYREAGKWVGENIPRDSRVLTHWWVYQPTDHFGFSREIHFPKASELSAEKFQKADPDWAVLVDSDVFHDPVFARALGPYEKLLRGIKTGEIPGYRPRAEFSPDPFWEKWAGLFFREYSGFRILVYQKAADQ
ncbi:MAG: glycosyltransferase family 39 protein [bacterium]|nr:glycosyltransferase family 39 protein [bacterium]